MKTTLITAVFLTIVLVSCNSGSGDAAQQAQDSIKAAEMEAARQQAVADSIAKAEAEAASAAEQSMDSTAAQQSTEEAH
ncbi:MAG: hypothetical protein R2813_11860 [Flavobacteriales bacterium]